MKLEFFVKQKRLTRKGNQALVGDTGGHYTFTVEFDREWDGLAKVVVFQNGDATAQVLYTGEAPLPAQVCGKGALYVACHGYRRLGDSVAVIRTIRMSRPLLMLDSQPMAGEEAQPYTPTLFEQVVAAAGEASDAAAEARDALEQISSAGLLPANLETIIQAALSEAKQSGLFDGAPGKDGVGIRSIAFEVQLGNIDYYTITYTDGTTSDFSVTNAYFSVESVAVTGEKLVVRYVGGETEEFDLPNGGGGSGEQGEDGGYYKPTVTQPTSSTMRIAFTPSEADMPTVAPVTVTLPKGADGQDGSDGSPGADGSDGADGVGIASIRQTTTSAADGGNNVFTVTLTNGTSAAFTVKNGSKGSTGAPGKDGADGKDGSDATVTAANIQSALGYAPAKQTDVDTLSAEIDNIKGLLVDGNEVAY